MGNFNDSIPKTLKSCADKQRCEMERNGVQQNIISCWPRQWPKDFDTILRTFLALWNKLATAAKSSVSLFHYQGS